MRLPFISPLFGVFLFVLFVLFGGDAAGGFPGFDGLSTSLDGVVFFSIFFSRGIGGRCLRGAGIAGLRFLRSLILLFIVIHGQLF